MSVKLIERAVWAYWEGGLSLVPINPETKRPYSKFLPQAVDGDGCLLFYRKEGNTLIVTTEPTNIRKGSWEPYQRRQPDKEEITDWLKRGLMSVAVVGGAVSGGVEILDFDVLGYYERFAEKAGPTVAMLPRQQTGGGGIQLAWRCPQPAGNQKLAWHPDETAHSGRIVAIETRGEHGYAVLPPSLHPSGRRYTLIAGRFSQIPKISQDERDYLLSVARSLCQAPKSKQEIERGSTEQRERKEYTGESVIDAYNAKHAIEDTLRLYNYTKMHSGRWSRPNKEASGGVIVLPGENKSYHYSSNDPLDADAKGKHQPRGPFDFFLEYDHNGNYTSAVKTAAKELGMEYKRAEPEQEQEDQLADEMELTGDITSIFNGSALLNASGVIICRNTEECSLLNHMGYLAVSVELWEMGLARFFGHIRHIYIIATAEIALRIKSGLRRARIISLPDGIATVTDLFANYTLPLAWLESKMA